MRLGPQTRDAGRFQVLQDSCQSALERPAARRRIPEGEPGLADASCKPGGTSQARASRYCRCGRRRSDGGAGLCSGWARCARALLPPYFTSSSFTPRPERRLSRARVSAKKHGIILQPVVEPIVLRLKTDQHAGRLSMTCDDDLALRRLTQIARQVVFDSRRAAPALRLTFRVRPAMSQPPLSIRSPTPRPVPCHI